VAPPAGRANWEVRFLETDAARGWENLCRQSADNTLGAWERMRRMPAPPAFSPRQHRLRHELATGVVKGRILDHWQIEVTGAGRIWYLVDEENRTVWVDHAGPGHPKATE
jgi:hypothetical protein